MPKWPSSHRASRRFVMKTVLTLLHSVSALAVLVPASSVAHYPFPCSPEEKQKAKQIEAAAEAKSQAAVQTLIDLLGDKNPRVQTAALLGTMRLSTTSLDCTAVEATARVLKDSVHTLVSAAAEATTIVFDKQLTIDARRAQLVKLTQSTEGRDRAATVPRGQCKEGYRRRMAVEALGVVGDHSVLPALEALANDSFGDHDDSFDMQAVALPPSRSGGRFDRGTWPRKRSSACWSGRWSLGSRSGRAGATRLAIGSRTPVRRPCPC